MIKCMKYPSNIGYRYPTTFIWYRYPTSIRCRYLTNIEWYLMNIGSETYYIMISFRLKCHTFFYRYMYFEWWAYKDGFDTDCIRFGSFGGLSLLQTQPGYPWISRPPEAGLLQACDQRVWPVCPWQIRC